jgi:hypothetical protein
MVCPFVRKPHGIPTWLSLVLSIQVLLCALVVTRQAAALPQLAQEDAAAATASAPATMLTLMSIVSRGPTVPASLTTGASRGEVDDGVDDENEAPGAQPSLPASAAWFAGFCDPRGASGIAPLPALPVQGGSVDADDGPCNGSRLQSATNVHGNDDIPSRLAADGDALLLALPTVDFALPRRFAQRTLPRETERRWALPRGYRRSVDHPPRV